MEKNLSFAVHNMRDEFHHHMTLSLQDLPPSGEARVRVTAADGRRSVRIELKENDATTSTLDLSAADLDQLIFDLAQARADLADQVPFDLKPGTKLAAQIDPAWRT